MGTCGGAEDKKFKRIEELKENFKEYHIGSDNYKYQPKDDLELLEYWKKFTSKKDELSKSNTKLFYALFNREDMDKTEFSYEGLKTDDEEKFYFFLNKRKFTKINLSQSVVVFPRFTYQEFPKYEDRPSKLKSISITGSNITLEENEKRYKYLENLEELNLGYNHLDKIPDCFSHFKNLKTLILRRNYLSSLPKTFDEMDKLEEVDLSENCFQECPKQLFVKKGEKKTHITKLNLSSNELLLFESQLPEEYNETLKFLYLANNKLSKVPPDIMKFKKLIFCNLDDNDIKDSDNFDTNQMTEGLKISAKSEKATLEWGPKEGNKDNKKDNKKEQEKENEKEKKSIFVSRSSTIIDDNGVSSSKIEYGKGLKKFVSRFCTSLNLSISENSGEEKKENEELKNKYSIVNIEGKEPQMVSELAEKMNEIIKSLDKPERKKWDKSEKEKFLKQERFKYMAEQIENSINNGEEMEINLIVDFELKKLYKKCYNAYLKKKKFEISGEVDYDRLDELEKFYFDNKVFRVNDKNEEKKEEKGKEAQNKNKDIEDNEKDHIQKQIEKAAKENITSKKEDISNIKFLKEINLLVTSHPIRFHLQFLRNIDPKINELVLQIWEKEEKSAFILILTELKIFLGEMLSKYEQDPTLEKYEVEKSQDRDVVHSIYLNSYTKKILHHLGLKKKMKEKRNGIQQEIFTFSINQNMKDKYLYFSNFLSHFIQIVRESNFEPIDLETN